MSTARLTKEDVQRLLTDPSGEVRAGTAEKLALEFERGGLTDNERRLAAEIFRLMVRDAEVRVREALSRNLSANPDLPRDIARSLAQDVDSVALPIIEFSTVLTDDDLLEIVRGQDANKLKAVAKREIVTAPVSAALVENGDEETVAILVGNRGADISEEAMLKVVDRFGHSERVNEPLVKRARLPVTVAERLVTLVSAKLQEHLLRHHELPAAVATDLMLQARERATITLSSESTEDEVDALVRHLRDNGRLTPSIVLRALCMGDMKFFEYALAVQAGVPVVNARILVHDAGPLGFSGLYEQAGFPGQLFPAFQAAVDVAKETEYDGLERDRERYQRRMIERILTQYGEQGVEFEGDDVDYLMTRMSQLPATMPRM